MSTSRQWLSGILSATATLWIGLSIGLLMLAAWSQPGHTAKPPIQFELEHPAIKQGSLTQLWAENVPESLRSLRALVNGKSFRFFPQRPGLWLALIPADPLTTPGAYPLKVVDDTGTTQFQSTLTVKNARFKNQYIKVSRKTAGLQATKEELNAIGGLKRVVSDTRYWDKPFVSPVPECMNSPFGVKRYYNGKFSGNYHKGIDQRSPRGRNVVATSGGVIKIANQYRLHGGTVGIDHGQGVSSIYIHLDKILVKRGQLVQQGQVIGKVGSSGFATGPHLHWGLYANNTPIDPMQWIKIKRCG